MENRVEDGIAETGGRLDDTERRAGDVAERVQAPDDAQNRTVQPIRADVITEYDAERKEALGCKRAASGKKKAAPRLRLDMQDDAMNCVGIFMILFVVGLVTLLNPRDCRVIYGASGEYAYYYRSVD